MSQPLIKSHQDMEATKVPINRPMDTEDMLCRPDGILLNHKENESLPFAAPWMDPKSTVKCQTEKDKYSALPLIRGIQKINR